MRHLLAGLTTTLAIALCTAAHADPGNLILNPNFAGSAGENCYCGITSWAFSTVLGTTATSGVPALGLQAANNTGSSTSMAGFWDNGTTPDGIATAGTIQDGPVGTPLATNTLTQILTGLTVGSVYAVSYLENARSTVNYGIPMYVSVLVGNAVAVQSHNDSVAGGSNAFRTVSGQFEATASSEVFEFLVTGTTGDGTALLTDVSVTAAPEPQSLALLGVGLASVALVLRKRMGRRTSA